MLKKRQLKRDGYTYLEKNGELAGDVMTVLDSLRSQIQYELKVNLTNLSDKFTSFSEI